MMRPVLLLLAALAGLLATPASAAPKTKATPAPTLALIERGKLVFTRNCAPCHGQGPGDDGSPRLPGTARLEARYNGSLPGALELRSDLTADVLRYFIRNGSGPMPMFRKTEVSDQDILAIEVYLQQSAAKTRK
ncbi:MAG: cytochrome c [Sphingobium sp.]|nr:cytochrome c [Sphingobium sp.]